MDLGSSRVDWFPYVPIYNGNRSLPKDQQLGCEIRRMRSMDRIDMLSWGDDGAIAQWRDQHLQKQLQGDDGAIIKNLPDGLLLSLRRFRDNVRSFKNFTIDGHEQTDPDAIFFHLAGMPAADDSLLAELINAVINASALGDDELKNYKAQCDGSKPLKSIALLVDTISPPPVDTPTASVEGSI